GEREKVKSEPVAAPTPEGQTANPITEEEAAIQTVAETEVFYTFTWAPRPRAPRADTRGNRANRPAGEKREAGEKRDGGRPRGKPKGKPHSKGKREEPAKRSFEARPAKKDRIDPDNPFAAALMGLRDKI
ncbi:MAG: disulfide oxidoreductase, partial [Paracoccaceae bacterium]|nr:disulfide oxidoreductase [Paracoccaceae bacterium]